ncbi:MAG: DUF899 family protein [Pseudomonadales bacterium]|nr:DUF899 family protein [Pseudomonadales bacterium]
MMHRQKIVAQDEWLQARKKLQTMEHQLQQHQQQIAEARAHMPWVKVDKIYEFHSPTGIKQLSELFDDKSQLIIFHVAFNSAKRTGSPHSAFIADHFNNTISYLAQNDIALAATSRAPIDKIKQYEKKMGWSFNWYSSSHNTFELDFYSSHDKDEELPCLSVFCKADDGHVYHCYSCPQTMLENMNTVFQLMDFTPHATDHYHDMSWLKTSKKLNGLSSQH